MIRKKKPVTTAKKTLPSESTEQEFPEKQRRVPITQVVEVVDDNSDSSSEKEKVDNSPFIENSTQEEDQVTEEQKDIVNDQNGTKESVDSDTELRNKKKMVDELFQPVSMKETPMAPEISVHTRTLSQPIYLWAIGVVACCIAIGAGLIIFTSRGTFKSISLRSFISKSTPTPIPRTPAPTPSELKRDAITIQVLNGGGKAGAASTMKKLLEEKGYAVSDTGNADSYTYDLTQVSVKAGKSAYIPILEKDLKSSYSLGTSSATLDDSLSYDVRIIVGKE